MEVKIAARDNAGIIELKGDLDFQSYKELETAFNASFSQGRSPIILDISEVPHVDSVGLGAITRLWKAANQQGVDLVLACPRKNVRSMIKLVNLDGRIRLADTVEDGL